MVSPGKFDVILRFGDEARFEELDRCLFALAMQDYQPLNVHLLCPGRSRADRARLADAIAPTLSLNPGMTLEIGHRPELDRAIAETAGRYLAFLDENDVVQPWGFATLVGELEATGSTLAFGAVMDKFEQRLLHANITVGQRLCRAPERLSQLFGNLYWWTSAAAVDRAQIATADLAIEWPRGAHELMLRLCAKYRSSFGQRSTIVADHYATEQSNTNEALQALTLSGARSVSAEVQRSLGVDAAQSRNIIGLAEGFDPFA